MTRLIIVRHGNTFGPGEVPRRVGGKTDIPLVESGIAQASALGTYFRSEGISPDIVYTSDLQRTKQTAEYILEQLQIDIPVKALSMFNEVNYGPDEDKVEEEVIARLGKEALQKWDEDATVPEGWEFNPEKAINDWKVFGKNISEKFSEQTVMVVTSNGIARFAPYLTGNYDQFKSEFNIKLKTGSFGILEYINGSWYAEVWGLRP